MSKTMLELLANSFTATAYVVEDGIIALPARIENTMGTSLKGAFYRGSPNYALISKQGDKYFEGSPLAFSGDFLVLPPPMCKHLKLAKGDLLLCRYNGAGDYFTIVRAAAA